VALQPEKAVNNQEDKTISDQFGLFDVPQAIIFRVHVQDFIRKQFRG